MAAPAAVAATVPAASATPSKGRLLIVDDDNGVVNLLRRVLLTEGFSVDVAGNATYARACAVGCHYDLVILDLGRTEDGLDVLSDLRSRIDAPVIVVSGRGAEHDRVLGLRMGADDYVVKPFSYLELVARVETVLRRATGRRAQSAMTRQFDSLHIDLAARQVSVDGHLVETTAKEFDLLVFMSGSPRQVFSRDQLLGQVWASSSDWQDPATVTEHVRRVRAKIEPEPDHPRWIVTVRGVGYRFEPSSDGVSRGNF